MSTPSPVMDGVVRGVTQAIVLVVSVFLFLAIFGVLVFAVSLGVGAGMAGAGGDGRSTGYVHVTGKRDSRNKLLVLRVDGPILGVPPRDRATSFFFGGFTFGYEIQQQLEEAAQKSEIKGVLLHMQTPGGTIFGSRAIHDGVVKYRERTKKPVVVYIEGLSASGGVMAMVGASSIWADHGSLIGSIGVLGPQLLFYNNPVATDGSLLEAGIVTQGGIEQTIISAGRGKDLGNPFRRPTPEEVATLTTGVQAEYDQFVAHVARSRKMDPATIRDRMGAMVFDNTAAQRFGLIDGTATRGETIQKLADAARVPKDFQVVRPGDQDTSLLRWVLASATSLREPRAQTGGLDVLRRELCSSVRAPLVYYGDPAVACR